MRLGNNHVYLSGFENTLTVQLLEGSMSYNFCLFRMNKSGIFFGKHLHL